MTPEETKEWIWSRCHEDGDCVLWDGAVDDSGVPQLRRPGSRKVEPARRVLLAALGQEIKGRVATTTCQHPRCMAEEHCVAWTRKQLQKRSGQKLVTNIVRAAKLAAIGRERVGKLSMEKVRAARAAGMTGRAFAAETGVTLSTAQKALRGDAWKEYGANPFSGLLAANEKRRAA